MADENKNVYTSDGFQRLQDELSERKTTVTAEITARLEEARSQGDLSENSEYDDAKDAQAKNEARIKEIEALLNFENRLSVDSPVGKAIIGRKKGASVTVTTPAGAFKYKIIKIGK